LTTQSEKKKDIYQRELQSNLKVKHIREKSQSKKKDLVTLSHDVKKLKALIDQEDKRMTMEKKKKEEEEHIMQKSQFESTMKSAAIERSVEDKEEKRKKVQ